jgi:hypothetical protein
MTFWPSNGIDVFEEFLYGVDFLRTFGYDEVVAACERRWLAVDARDKRDPELMSGSVADTRI